MKYIDIVWEQEVNDRNKLITSASQSMSTLISPTIPACMAAAQLRDRLVQAKTKQPVWITVAKPILEKRKQRMSSGTKVETALS